MRCVILCLCVALIRGQTERITIPTGGLTATSTNSDPTLSNLANAYDADPNTCLATAVGTTTYDKFTYNLGRTYSVNSIVLKTDTKPTGQTFAKMDAITVSLSLTASGSSLFSCNAQSNFTAGSGTATFRCSITGIDFQYVVLIQKYLDSMLTICNTEIYINPFTTIRNNGIVIKGARFELLILMVLTMTALSKMLTTCE